MRLLKDMGLAAVGAVATTGIVLNSTDRTSGQAEFFAAAVFMGIALGRDMMNRGGSNNVQRIRAVGLIVAAWPLIEQTLFGPGQVALSELPFFAMRVVVGLGVYRATIWYEDRRLQNIPRQGPRQGLPLQLPSVIRSDED